MIPAGTVKMAVGGRATLCPGRRGKFRHLLPAPAARRGPQRSTPKRPRLPAAETGGKAVPGESSAQARGTWGACLLPIFRHGLEESRLQKGFTSAWLAHVTFSFCFSLIGF